MQGEFVSELERLSLESAADIEAGCCEGESPNCADAEDTSNRILVVNKHDVEQYRVLEKDGIAGINALFSKCDFHTVDRDRAERNTLLLQVVPYVVVFAPVDGETKVLVYNRGEIESEGRLHGKTSIGVGGHIEWEDLDAADGSALRALEVCAQRELYEEFGIYYPHTTQLYYDSLIYDDSNDVGKVHLGVLMKVLTYRPELLFSRFDYNWESQANLSNALDNMEPWSRAATVRLGNQRAVEEPSLFYVSYDGPDGSTKVDLAWAAKAADVLSKLRESELRDNGKPRPNAGVIGVAPRGVLEGISPLRPERGSAVFEWRRAVYCRVFSNSNEEAK